MQSQQPDKDSISTSLPHTPKPTCLARARRPYTEDAIELSSSEDEADSSPTRFRSWSRKDRESARHQARPIDRDTSSSISGASSGCSFGRQDSSSSIPATPASGRGSLRPREDGIRHVEERCDLSTPAYSATRTPSSQESLSDEDAARRHLAEILEIVPHVDSEYVAVLIKR